MNIIEWREYLSKIPRDKLSSSAKLLGHTLSLFYRTGNKTYPTVKLLSERASVGEGTVNNAIKELISYGLIKTVKGILPGEKSERNFYIFSGVEDSELTNCNTSKASVVEASGIEASTTDTSITDASDLEASIIKASTVEASGAEASDLEASTDTSMVEASTVEVKIDIYRSKKEKERERENSPPPDFDNLDLKKEKPKWYEYFKTKHPGLSDEIINISYGKFLGSRPKTAWTYSFWQSWVLIEKPEKYKQGSPELHKSIPSFKFDPVYESTLDKDFQKVRKWLYSKYGDAIFSNWLQHLRLKEIKNGEIILISPTEFIKESIERKHSEAIAEILNKWVQIVPGIKKILIIVDRKLKEEVIYHAN